MHNINGYFSLCQFFMCAFCENKYAIFIKVGYIRLVNRVSLVLSECPYPLQFFYIPYLGLGIFVQDFMEKKKIDQFFNRTNLLENCRGIYKT